MSTPVDPQLHDDACTLRVLIFVESVSLHLIESVSSHLIFACIIFLLVSASGIGLCLGFCPCLSKSALLANVMPRRGTKWMNKAYVPHTSQDFYSSAGSKVL